MSVITWNKVVDLVGTQDLPLQAVLRSFQIISVDDDQVVIGAEHAFHLSEVRSNKRLVRRAVSQALGRDVRLKIRKVVPPDPLDDPVVQFAVEELGARARSI